MMVKNTGLWIHEALDSRTNLALTNYTKLLTLSGPWFSHQCNRLNNIQLFKERRKEGKEGGESYKLNSMMTWIQKYRFNLNIIVIAKRNKSRSKKLQEADKIFQVQRG